MIFYLFIYDDLFMSYEIIKKKIKNEINEKK